MSRAAVLLAVVASALAAVVAPGWLAGHQRWVLAGGFLLGLPHGAVDHLLPARHRWVRRGPAGLLAVLVGYLGLAALTFAALRLASPVVLPVLLAVSVLHFGAGDLATADNPDPSDGPRPSDSSTATRPSSSWSRLFGALARGGPVLAGPLLAWPAATGAALATVGLGKAPSLTTETLVGVVLLSLSTTYAFVALRGGRLVGAAEVVLLVALFTVAPPLAAFGVYFGLWHGLRHTARLLADDPANTADLTAGRTGRPLLRFLTAAAVPSVVALATVIVLVGLTVDHADLVGPVFAALLALTVPHVVIVGRWDVDQHREPVHPRTSVTTSDTSGALE